MQQMHDPLETSAVVADSLDHLPSPPSGSHIASSPSGDLGANEAMIAIILLCGLICGLSLNVAIRCFLRGPDNTPSSSTTPRKPPVVSPWGPFAWETTLARGEAEDVCAVCLTEFTEGESIRVLGKCKHGFHVECIEKWLRSHSSSCPTCRTSCLLEDESSSTSSQVLEIEGNVNVNEQCDENNGGQSIDDGRPQRSRIESV